MVIGPFTRLGRRPGHRERQAVCWGKFVFVAMSMLFGFVCPHKWHKHVLGFVDVMHGWGFPTSSSGDLSPLSYFPPNLRTEAITSALASSSKFRGSKFITKNLYLVNLNIL